MHLIAALAAGFADAPNGSVSICDRGTSTRATYYEDFAGNSAVTPTANVALDASGRLICYVTCLVDCVVYDADGVAIATFTAGVAAANVEVRSQSFSGTDYETGVTAAGNPTTAAAIFDLWKTSTGGTNWNVLVGGVSTSLQTALSSIGGIVYNVLSYGAAGNGTTDDTTAIQAAITACNAAGGGIVWLPEGTYRTTSVLTVSDKVSLAGAGAHCTTINCDHASNNLLTYSGSSTARWQELAGLRLKYAQTSSGVHVTVASGTLLRISGCDIGTDTQSVAAIGTNTSATTVVNIYDTAVRMGNGAAGTCITVGGVAKRVSCFGCTFIAPVAPAYDRMVYGDHITLVGCVFDTSGCTDTSVPVTLRCYLAGSTTLDAIITDCVFTADGGGSAATVAIALGTPIAASVFSESNNVFACDTAYSYTITAANVGSHIRLGSREGRVKIMSSATTPIAVPTDQYGVVLVTSTVAGSVTLTGTMPPVGARGSVVINNSDASSRAFTLGGGFAAASHATPGTPDVAATIATNSGDAFDYYAVVIDPDVPAAGMITRWYLNA